MTGYIYDSLYLEHETGQHPECPDRLRSIQNKLENSAILPALHRVSPRPATVQDIERVHQPGYAAGVAAACAAGGAHLDADTAISPRSHDAALLSAGAGLTAVDLVVDGKCENAFCAVRPPGHHAEHDRSMGFCLFNNVAIAARYAQKVKGLERVFIFDWDVHHGNGTQHSFYADPAVFYSSIHQYPFYPGTGGEDETGTGDGLGATLNFPMRAFSGDDDYMKLIENRLIPQMHRFRPDLILLSAGFDAHAQDPLAQMTLTTEGYGRMTGAIRGAARELCQGRLVSMLEGGYNLDALADSAHIHLARLAS
ncbi:MAG: histone deacetylase [Nitrospinaceae bacterium]